MSMTDFAAFGVDPRGPCRAAQWGALPPAACGGPPRSIWTKKKEAGQ